jgi:hypothetical protein
MKPCASGAGRRNFVRRWWFDLAHG